MTCGTIDDIQAAVSRIDATIVNNVSGNPIFERKWELISVEGPSGKAEHGNAFFSLHVNQVRLFDVAHALACTAHEWRLEFGSIRFEFNYTTETPVTVYLKRFREEGK